MNDLSGIAVGNLVEGSGVYAGTTVVGVASEDLFVEINQGLNLDDAETLTATFYTLRTFTQQSYTFAGNDRYVIRADASLPFGSFPGVGTIKT
jgi:hypothetical protein